MIFLWSLIIIIIIHELGHLWAAKMCNCGVKVFSIGFGKPLIKFTKNKTIYQIAPILLGGYCELQDELGHSRSKTAFTNKTYSQKVFISLAGIFMNLLTGAYSYCLFLMTQKDIFLIFAMYSIILGISNALPIPALDGSYPFIFLFEKKWGKKKTYKIWGDICQKWLKWLIIINVLSIPYLIWLIWTGRIL
jgi:membrane-associated protease RseP (regulator of RpoE activity)